MADKLLDILDATASRLATETVAGGELADIRVFVVEYSATQRSLAYGYATPLLLVRPLTKTKEILTVDGSFWDTTAPIEFVVVKEENKRNEARAVARLIDICEGIFALQTFNLSEWVSPVSVGYDVGLEPPYAAPEYRAVGLTIEHRYTDVRALPAQG